MISASSKEILTLFFSSTLFNSGEASQASSHNQMGGAMDKECGANNNMATNYTVNGGVQKDSVP